VIFAGTPRGARVDDPVFPDGVPRMDSASAQIAYARGLKRSMAGREGRERALRREMAIEAYRAVRIHHPRVSSCGAEGAFRAGELLRAGGRTAEALAELEKARELGRRTPFRARASLEIGHIHRREGRRRPALDAYLRVASDPRAAHEHRDDAWLWAGFVWKELGRLQEARDAWRSVTRTGADPIDRILAFDYLALAWVDAGDLEAAAGVLDECVRAHSELALEETRSGERVRKALLRMRVVAALPRAVEERRSKSREDDAGRDNTRERSSEERIERDPDAGVLRLSKKERRDSLDMFARLFHRMHMDPPGFGREAAHRRVL